MDSSSCWNRLEISKPAITTVPIARVNLETYSRNGGHHIVDEWLVDLSTTLAQLARELNQLDITKLMNLETSYLQQIVQQRMDIRAEKFYPKMKQASQAARRWLKFCTPKLVEDVSQLMKPPKNCTTNKLQEYRLASPAVLRHLLCHLARGHGTLRQTVMYCEEAAVWLQCKMSIAQRSGLALALYSIVSRLRALSLYLMHTMSTGYEKLSVLVFGVPLSTNTETTGAEGHMVLDGLPKHLSDNGEVEEKKQLRKVTKKPDVMSLLGDIFNEKGAGASVISANNDGDPDTDSDEGHEAPPPAPPSAALLGDDDLGEVIKRQPLLSNKKRKRDTSQEKLSKKKRKGNTEDKVAKGTNDNLVKKKKKKK